MKQAIKSLFNAVFFVLAAPLGLAARWTAGIDKSDTFFQFCSQFVSLIPGMPGIYWRRQHYRLALSIKPNDFVVGFGAIFAVRGSTIGSNAYIGTYCTVGLASIGDDCLIGSNVDIIAGPDVHHFGRLDIPIREQGGKNRKIHIGTDSWIGNSAIVFADIGDHCVIGAGALVNKPCDDFGVYVGNPARRVRDRRTDDLTGS